MNNEFSAFSESDFIPDASDLANCNCTNRFTCKYHCTVRTGKNFGHPSETCTRKEIEAYDDERRAEIYADRHKLPHTPRRKKFADEAFNYKRCSKNLSPHRVFKETYDLYKSRDDGGIDGTVLEMMKDLDPSYRKAGYIVLQQLALHEITKKDYLASGMISKLLKSLPRESADIKVIILETLNSYEPEYAKDLVQLGGLQTAQRILEGRDATARGMSAKFVAKLVSCLVGAMKAFQCGVVDTLFEVLRAQHRIYEVQHKETQLNSLEALVKIGEYFPGKLMVDISKKFPEVFCFIKTRDLDVAKQSLELMHSIRHYNLPVKVILEHKEWITRLTRSKDERIAFLARRILDIRLVI